MTSATLPQPAQPTEQPLKPWHERWVAQGTRFRHGTGNPPRRHTGYKEHWIRTRRAPCLIVSSLQLGSLHFSKENQVRGSVVRLPPTFHGVGDATFIPRLTNLYRQRGSVVCIVEGAARRPVGQRDEAAILVRLALGKGSTGARCHAVAEQGVLVRNIW